MRRFHLEPSEFAAGEGAEVRLTGARARRLREVLRIRQGASLAVFDGNGEERNARVGAISGAVVTLILGTPREAAPEPPVPVVLVCAFPRASRGDWLVEKAVEVGVAQIVPLEADRSVLQPGEGRVSRWQRIAIEAAEQCGRSRIPLIGGAPPEGALHLVADPDAGALAHEVVAYLDTPPAAVVVHIGPEGGWSSEELTAFEARGALGCSLGPRLLRVETAAIIAASQVLQATGGLAPAPGREWLL